MPIPFEHTYRTTNNALYVDQSPESVSNPKLLLYNEALARNLSIPDDTDLNAIFSGNVIAPGSYPLAMAYSGHQFGNFVPLLGDGRALLIGELKDTSGRLYDLHLKGSGRTPFSRQGDGRAPLSAVLREYIVSEAMHSLGISTTRSLSAIASGEIVYRRVAEPGGVLCRVAKSHIRIGTFEYCLVTGEQRVLNSLLDYAIHRLYPELNKSHNKALAFLEKIVDLQAKLVADWMSVGFIHGVMNTDNGSISGETIDYGPCAFMDVYNPETVFSSIDTFGRYAYGRQPSVMHWNLSRLAECLTVLLSSDTKEAFKIANETVNRFPDNYKSKWYEKMLKKIGYKCSEDKNKKLLDSYLGLLFRHRKDFTNSFRMLPYILTQADDEFLLTEFNQDPTILSWVKAWKDSLKGISYDAKLLMNQNNPAYIPRNQRVEEALSAALTGDLEPTKELIKVLSNPYQEQVGKEKYTRPPLENTQRYVTYCGT